MFDERGEKREEEKEAEGERTGPTCALLSFVEDVTQEHHFGNKSDLPGIFDNFFTTHLSCAAGECGGRAVGIRRRWTYYKRNELK